MSKVVFIDIILTVQVLLIVFSAVLLTLSLPNEFFELGIAAFGLIALIPAFIVVIQSPTRVRASRLGALFGAISTLMSNYWLAFFGEFSIWTIGGTVIGYTGYNYILFGYLHYLTHAGNDHLLPDESLRIAVRPIHVAVAWTGYEYLKSVGFLGYPWGLVAYPISFLGPVAQIAELAGPWGLTFLGAYANAALTEMILSRRRGIKMRGDRTSCRPIMHPAIHAVAAGCIFVVAIAFGLFRLSGIHEQRSIDMLLVQQNVDSWHPGRFTDALERAQQLSIDSITGQPSDKPVAVVWSETSLRVPYASREAYYLREPESLPFRYFLKLIDTPLVTGTAQPVAGTQDYTNSAVVILPDGTITGTYGKQQLVPFAESIPFWDVPIVQTFFRTIVGLSGTWVPGDGSHVLPLPVRGDEALRIGTPICFEDAFGWVTRDMVNDGAELLVNLTNNSWSRQESAQYQHFAAARLRTIELRTTLVRGTNSGLSGVIDATGTLIEELPMFVGIAETVSVPLYDETWTLYRAWGDWLGIISVIITLASVWYVSRRRVTL